MPLETDIIERIRSDFRPEELERALDLLSGSGETGRVARCITVASQGSLESLKHYIRLAKSDFRDAIVAGEYDAGMRQIRDLRVSFLIDRPEKMWIGEVACAMASRGYVLSSVETRAAPFGPFEYTADFGEGSANFVGPKGEIEVEKRNRQWMIHGDSKELELYDLNHAFHDESVFRDAVSCYLLTGAR